MLPAQPTHTKRRPLYIYASCGLTIFALVLINVVFSALLVRHSDQVATLESQKIQLQSLKQDLDTQLAARLSLSQLAQQAESAGYHSVDQTLAITLPSDSQVALR